MKGMKVVLVVLLLGALLLAGTALAQGPVDPSPDVGPTGTQDGASSYDPPLFGGEAGASIIVNGDFNDWANGQPVGWTLWAETKDGWETAHPSEVDLALSSDGVSNALGWFVRNVGGDGAYYAGAYQALPEELPAGYYFVNVSETIIYGGDTSPYNSVAWYGIGSSADPNSVTQWRELDPYTIQCPNDWGICTYVGRDETVMLNPGDYFHLMVSHKFPIFNSWSAFIIDDVSAVPADPEGPLADYPNGYYDWLDWAEYDLLQWLFFGDEKCHYMDEWCYPYIPSVVVWDPDQPW